MGKSPKSSLDHINQTITAWETHRSTKSFGGMTLEQLKIGVAPSLTTRTTVAQLESELKAAISLREKADDGSDAIIKKMVAAVVAEEGEDSEFYEALGYVRASERKSGLHRATKADKTKPNA